MYQGTTPTLIFELDRPVDLSNIVQVKITIKDGARDKHNFDITKVDIDDSNKRIGLYLTQEETFSFAPGIGNVQIRMLNGSGTAFITERKMLNILAPEDGGVISAPGSDDTTTEESNFTVNDISGSASTVIKMKLQDVVLVGGGDPPTGEIQITENGRYNVTAYASANVEVPGSTPTGKVTITQNGTNIDVAQYAKADVNVPQGVFPTGTLQITENGEKTVTTYEKVNVAVPGPSGKITITENATGINIASYAEADVAVSGGSPSGTINISTNGDHDVSAFATAHVAVPTNEIPLRDRLIIPDKYNTGCKGDLAKFDYEEDTSGLVWSVDVENGLVLNFNLDYSTTIKNLQPNTTVVFENLDFTNYNSVKIMNALSCRKDSANYVAGIKIVFKNCLFITLGANYEFTTEDMISFEVYNSSFANTSWPNTKFYNCLIGNKTFYKDTYGMSILGDGAQPRSYTSFTNCYFMDIEPEVDEAGSAHFDGLQTLATENQPYARSHHLYNCRFECIDMPYVPSGGGWSYAVFWQGSNPDSSMEYCQVHGGGYYQTSILKGERQTVQNNFIEQSYSSPCYPGDAVYQMTDNWAEYYTNLFVSSVWLEDNEICIVCSNDIGTAKTLRVVTDTNTEYTFNIAACPTFGSQALSEITCWNDLPFDKIYKIPAYGVRSIKCYDGQTEIRSWTVDASAPLPTATLSITQNGEYSVLDYAKVDVAVPGTTPTGTINITANGDIDVTNYANAHVAVPQDSSSLGYVSGTEAVIVYSENGNEVYY